MSFLRWKLRRSLLSRGEKVLKDFRFIEDLRVLGNRRVDMRSQEWTSRTEVICYIGFLPFVKTPLSYRYSVGRLNRSLTSLTFLFCQPKIVPRVLFGSLFEIFDRNFLFLETVS